MAAPSASRITAQTNWVWWLVGGAGILLLLFLVWGQRGRIATPTTGSPAVAELERATAIIKAADEHRKALGCDDCSTRVEAAVREVELQRLRKEVEKFKAAKPTAQAGKLDITVRQMQIPLPPLPPPARHPCEPVDPCRDP